MAMSLDPGPPMPSFCRFVKGKISLAPNNASAWNYFRGILNHVRIPYSTQTDFVELYVVDAVDDGVDRVLDLENPPPSEGAQLPCSTAIEFMADVHEANGKEGIAEAVKVRPISDSSRCLCHTVTIMHCHQLWRSLAHTHDTIRKRYVVNLRRHRPSNKACHEDRYWEFRIRDGVANTSVA